MSTKPQISSAAIKSLLRHRYAAPEWASWLELRLGTGYTKRAGIDPAQAWDFAALNLYPSKGNALVVVEIKISRADFLRELNNPAKRKAAEDLATETWFAMPSGLAQLDEIPEGWGLLEVVPSGMRRKKAAQQRQRPPLPEHLVWAIARRTSDPPDETPPWLWKLAGKEVTATELLEEARKVWGAEKTRLNSDRDNARNRELRIEFDALRSVLMNVCGYRNTTPELIAAFKTWLESGSNLTDRDRKLAQRLAIEVPQLLLRVVGGGEGTS